MNLHSESSTTQGESAPVDQSDIETVALPRPVDDPMWQIKAPAAKAPVRDALVGLLFRQNGWVTMVDAQDKVDAFLAQYPVIAYAEYSVALLNEIKSHLVTREDMDMVKMHLDLCNPAQPREVVI